MKTEPSPLNPPVKQEGLTWQQVQTQYGQRYQLPPQPPPTVKNYTTVESQRGLQIYYQPPQRPLQRSEWDVRTVAQDVASGMSPTEVSAKYGLTYHPPDVRELAIWAKTVPKEPFEPGGARRTEGAEQHQFFMDWEQPSRAGVPLATLTSPYSMPTRRSLGSSIFDPKFHDILRKTVLNADWWQTDPITGINVTKSALGRLTNDPMAGLPEGAKTSGVAYAWTAWDVYNIATTAMLIYSAGKVITSLIPSVGFPSVGFKTPQVPLWLKNVPKAIYYETVGRLPLSTEMITGSSAWQYASGIVHATPEFIGEVIAESPFGSVIRGVEVARYYAPELAGIIQTSRVYMTGEELVSRSSEYLSALRVIWQTRTPISWQIETSQPYMTFQHLLEAIPSGVRSSTPFEWEWASYYAKLGATYIKQAPSLIASDISIAVRESQPYMALQYAKETIPTLIAENLPLGFDWLDYQVGQAWTSAKQLPALISSDIGNIPTGIRERFQYSLPYELTKRITSETGYYSSVYLKPAGSLLHSDLKKIGENVGETFGGWGEDISFRVRYSLPYEFTKRIAYEVSYPISTKLDYLKMYLEHELYRLPRTYMPKTPYKGMIPTLGRADLPYRGFMGAVPKSFVEVPTGKGLSLLAETVTKEASIVTEANSMAKVALGFGIPELTQTVSTHAPSDYWRYKGPVILPTIAQKKGKEIWDQNRSYIAYPEKIKREPYLTLSPLTQTKASMPKIHQPLSSFTAPLIDASFDIDVSTGLAPMQEQASKAMQSQAVMQRQIQRQLTSQRTQQRMYQDFMGVRPRRKGKSPFDLSSRVRRYYPILRAKEVLKI